MTPPPDYGQIQLRNKAHMNAIHYPCTGNMIEWVDSLRAQIISYLNQSTCTQTLVQYAVWWFNQSTNDEVTELQLLETPPALLTLSNDLVRELLIAIEKTAKTETYAKMVKDAYIDKVHIHGVLCQQVSAIWLIRKMLMGVAPHPTLKAVFANSDIAALKYWGDDQLYEWLSMWARMVKNCTHLFDNDQLRDMLLEKIQDSKALAMILSVYKYTGPASERTYAHLLRLIDEYIHAKLTHAARARQDRELANLNKNRGMLMPANSPNPKADPAAPKSGKGKGKSASKFIKANPSLSTKQIGTVMSLAQDGQFDPTCLPFTLPPPPKANGTKPPRDSTKGPQDTTKPKKGPRDNSRGPKAKGAAPKDGGHAKAKAKSDKATDGKPIPTHLLEAFQKRDEDNRGPCLAFLNNDCKPNADGNCPKGYFSHKLNFNAEITAGLIKWGQKLKLHARDASTERKRAEGGKSGGGKGKGGSGRGPKGEGSAMLAAAGAEEEE